MTHKRDKCLSDQNIPVKFLSFYYLRVSHAAAKNADCTFLIATSRHRTIKSQL